MPGMHTEELADADAVFVVVDDAPALGEGGHAGHRLVVIPALARGLEVAGLPRREGEIGDS